MTETGRKTLDQVCQKQGFTGYKSYLKSESFARVRELVCSRNPQCEYCGSKSKSAVFTNPNPSNLFGLSTEGIVAVCLACEHKIKTTKDGRKRQVRHQISMADGMQTKAPLPYGSNRLSPQERDELLKNSGFQNFSVYMTSPLFQDKYDDCMKHHHGRCGCCKSKATGIHFRWFTPANLLSPTNHGWFPICHTCRGKLQSGGKLTKSSMKRTDKRLQEMIADKTEEKAKARFDKTQNQRVAMEATRGVCCICENPANVVKEVAQQQLPLCYKCSGQAVDDKDFRSHVIWFAKTYGKRLGHFQPTDKPAPKPEVQTFVTKDHGQLPSNPLCRYMRITNPGNGADNTPF